MSSRDAAGRYLPGHASIGGRTKLPPELQNIRSITQQELSKIVSKYLAMDAEQITKASKDEKLPMIHLIVMKLIGKCLTTGDERTFESLRTWCMGKTKDDLDSPKLSNHEVADEIKDISRPTLIDYLREREKLARKG